jgi:DNA mismatch endonuclease (patch repair protein)
MKEHWEKTRHSNALSGRVSRDTKPEMSLRRALHARGLRFRLHRAIGERLTVDIILPRYRIALFVDGCYWHGHGCDVGGAKPARGPNAAAWAAKLKRVKGREVRAARLLAEAGFIVNRVWECQIRRDVDAVAKSLMKIITKQTTL